MIRVGWCVVLFFHVFNAVYASSLAYIYHYMASPIMDYYVQLLQMMPQKNYSGVITLYACIGAMNFYSAVKMSCYSLYYKRLVFGKMKDLQKFPGDDDRKIPERLTRFQAFKRFAAGFARAISARGEWFDVVLLMREVSRSLRRPSKRTPRASSSAAFG